MRVPHLIVGRVGFEYVPRYLNAIAEARGLGRHSSSIATFSDNWDCLKS
jgi:hypothetical protein